MTPHHAVLQNHLPRWQRHLLNADLIVLTLSGLAWLGIHYSLGAGSAPDSLPHPAESWLMKLHGAAGFWGLYILGVISALHVPRGWRRGHKRISAVILLSGWLGSILTAWLLYYGTSSTPHALVSWLHIGFATLLLLVLAIHRQKTLRRCTTPQ
jgi:hypothetical protein